MIFIFNYFSGPTVASLSEYEKLLKHYLLKQSIITKDHKLELRKLRQTNHISEECHIKLLRTMNWTIDEYEVSELLLLAVFCLIELLGWNEIWFTKTKWNL